MMRPLGFCSFEHNSTVHPDGNQHGCHRRGEILKVIDSYITVRTIHTSGAETVRRKKNTTTMKKKKERKKTTSKEKKKSKNKH